MRGVRIVIAVLLSVLTLLSGCARMVPGRASAMDRPAPLGIAAAGVAPPPPDSAATAPATTAAVQEYWRQAFPAAFGHPWRDIASFVPVATRHGAATPPCVHHVTEIVGQAFYCPAADAVVWDADGLLPRIQSRFGPAGVVVVLAHEIGHAVQSRLGIDRAQARSPARYPSILLEAMSDCYAGVTMAHLAQHPAEGLDLGPDSSGTDERDAALLALVGFRDPVGISAGDADAHGDAFDRVSSFQDGWSGTPGTCSAMTVAGRGFTEQRYSSAADRARSGNLPPAELIPAVGADARSWFTDLVANQVQGWRAPAIQVQSTGACPAGPDGGPAHFCPADGSVDVSVGGVQSLEDRFGDFAAATLIASRYALAALGALGRPTTGATAGSAAVCLTGAWTARLLDTSGTFTLSPGDLDEAVQVLLAEDWAERDDQGQADPDQDGFDRLGQFRTARRGGAGPGRPAAAPRAGPMTARAGGGPADQNRALASARRAAVTRGSSGGKSSNRPTRCSRTRSRSSPALRPTVATRRANASSAPSPATSASAAASCASMSSGAASARATAVGSTFSALARKRVCASAACACSLAGSWARISW